MLREYFKKKPLEHSYESQWFREDGKDFLSVKTFLGSERTTTQNFPYEIVEANSTYDKEGNLDKKSSHYIESISPQIRFIFFQQMKKHPEFDYQQMHDEAYTLTKQIFTNPHP